MAAAPSERPEIMRDIKNFMRDIKKFMRDIKKFISDIKQRTNGVTGGPR